MNENITENINNSLFSSPEDKSRLLEIESASPPPDYYSFDELTTYDEAKTPLTVVCGVENFKALYSLREHLRRNTAILAEPDLHRLRHLFENFDLSGLMAENNIYVVSGEDVKHLGDAIEQYFTIAISTEIFTVPPMEDREGEFAEGIESLKKFRHTSRSNQQTLDKFLTDWYVYFAKNLDDYFQTRPISRLRDGLRGQTCTIVGPGPTLDHQVDLLEKLSSGWLISVDTALPLLTDRGIIPDFVVTVDAGEDNLEYLEGIPAETTLVCPAYMDPKVVNLTDDFYIFEPNFPAAIWLYPEFDSPGLLAMSGSVSTTAVDLAKLLNPARCFLLGVDLSYPNLLAFSRLHPRYNKFTENLDRFTTLPEQNLHKIQEKETLTVTHRGKQLLTSELFVNWKSFFEYLIEGADFPVFRSSAGALPLNHTRPLPAQEKIPRPEKKVLREEGSEPDTDWVDLKEKLEVLQENVSSLEAELQVIGSLVRRNKDISAQWLNFTRIIGEKEEIVSYFQWEVSRLTRELREVTPEDQSEIFHRQFRRWERLLKATREGLETALDEL